MKQKTTQQIAFEEEEREAIRQANKAAEKSELAKDQLELFKNSVELASQVHSPLLDTLHTVTNAVPPLKLVVTSIVGMWDIMHAIFIDKKSSVLTRGSKVGMSLAIIGLGIAAIAAPPVAGALAIAAAGVVIGKELLHLGRTVNSYVATRKALHQETDANAKNILQSELTIKRNKVIDQAITTGLAISSLVGFALLITPFAPVGLSILIGSAAVGLTVKMGPPLFKRAMPYIKPLMEKFRAKFSTLRQKAKDKPKPQEVEHEGHDVHCETTASLSRKLALDDPKKEIIQGIKELHNKQSLHPKNISSEFKKPDNKPVQDTFDEDENEDETSRDKDSLH